VYCFFEILCKQGELAKKLGNRHYDINIIALSVAHAVGQQQQQQQQLNDEATVKNMYLYASNVHVQVQCFLASRMKNRCSQPTY
jgi:hypothetical protein